jgi:hypothetical protein
VIISSPRIALAVAFLITVLVGYGTFHLLFLSGYRYKPQDLEIVQGELARVDIIKSMRSQSLQIWLRGDSLPYRGSVGFPGYYQKDLVESLKPGTTITVGTLRAERAKPKRHWISGQEWIDIYSLSVEGTTAFALDDYNRWIAQNEKVGKIIMPILFVLGIGSMVSAVRVLRRGSSFD